MKRSIFLLLFSLCSSTALGGGNVSSVAPWHLLSGGYDSSINDGRIFGLPPTAPLPASNTFFFLKEDSFMTMSSDGGGISRSAPLTTSAAPPGQVWENVNGGPGFTQSYCGGYDECLAAGLTDFPLPGLSAGQIGLILSGPPSVMDRAGKNVHSNDFATGGWPSSLLAPGELDVGLYGNVHRARRQSSLRDGYQLSPGGREYFRFAGRRSPVVSDCTAVHTCKRLYL